jgi:hypothetical protein
MDILTKLFLLTVGLSALSVVAFLIYLSVNEARIYAPDFTSLEEEK